MLQIIHSTFCLQRTIYICIYVFLENEIAHLLSPQAAWNRTCLLGLCARGATCLTRCCHRLGGVVRGYQRWWQGKLVFSFCVSCWIYYWNFIWKQKKKRKKKHFRFVNNCNTYEYILMHILHMYVWYSFMYVRNSSFVC